MVGTFVKSRDPSVAEALAVAGYDFLIADLEHSSLSVSDVENMVRACSGHGVSVLARVAGSRLGLAGALLDAGATGIQVSDVSSVADASSAQAAVRYPPAGSRSVSVVTSAGRFGMVPVKAHIAFASESVVLAGQIESRTGLGALDSVIKCGVFDALFLGTTDLSVSLGHPGAVLHPDVAGALESAADEISASGMPFGVYCGNASQARAWAYRGASMLVVSSDLALLSSAAAETVEMLWDAPGG